MPDVTQKADAIPKVILLVGLISLASLIFSYLAYQTSRQIVSNQESQSSRNQERYAYCRQQVEHKRIEDWKERNVQFSLCNIFNTW